MKFIVALRELIKRLSQIRLNSMGKLSDLVSMTKKRKLLLRQPLW